MPHTVQLFATCIIDALYPEIGESVVRVLRRAGADVYFQPDQTCCGQPAFNAGMHKQAKEMAQHTIKTFERAPGELVLPSGSCTAMIRHHYPEMFDGDSEWAVRAKALADRTFEFTEYLVDIMGKVDLGAKWAGQITYHASCHLLRELGVSRQPRLLLEAVRGAEVKFFSQAEECCGFGGVFSVEHPELSASMLERKIANIKATGASTVVACDVGCLTHMNGGFYRNGLNLRGKYIAEILDSWEQ